MVARIRRAVKGQLQFDFAEPLKENPLIYWAREREAIRIGKELYGFPPPWTTDPILQTFRFCHVRRRDDRVSRWLRTHVLTQKNYDSVTWESFVLFTGLCRWINWPPTIKAIMDAGFWSPSGIDQAGIAQVIAKQAAAGKAFTGAYMITSSRIGGQSKPEFVAGPVMDELRAILPELKRCIIAKQSKEEAWNLLTSRMYWGGFMSGQVVDDWTWTPLLQCCSDNLTWAPQGPGSKRGLNRLLGVPLKTNYKRDAWLEHLIRHRKLLVEALGDGYEDLDLMSIQSCHCEVDKFLRVRNGEGRPRALFKSETAY